MLAFQNTKRRRAAVFAAAMLLAFAARSADFSVTPIRAELKPGAMSETITVSNDSTTRLRIAVKVMEWTQDADGKDVYTDSGDLVYFPRQMDVEPGAKRLVRVGAKKPADGIERTYRLFIEEVPEPRATGSPAAVNFYFRFGVPVFLPPPNPKPQPEAGEPTLARGKVSLAVRNAGNRHFRPIRFVVSDGAGFSKEASGWYSLANTTRSYEVDVPPEVCRRAGVLTVQLEGEGLAIERRLHVDPASCS